MRTLVIVNSSQSFEYENFKNSIFRALKHFGVFFEILDLSQTSISYEMLRKDVHLLIFAQEGLGSKINKEASESIIKATSKGLGLISFDGHFSLYPSNFLKELNLCPDKEKSISTLQLVKENCFVDTSEQEIPLKNPLTCQPNLEDENWSTFLKGDKETPCAAYTTKKNSKIIFFFLSSHIWLNKYLGFGGALDEIFRDAIVWAAKKPYIIKPMPPFVAMRVDGVSFSGNLLVPNTDTLSNLKWLDILNKYGFTPNIGLFIDEVKDEDAKKFKEKEEMKLAGFSPYAFKNSRYGENGDSCSIYMKHHGKEFTPEELKNNFNKIDERFKKWGVKYPKTVNSHYSEIGLNSLPFLKERGQKYLTTNVRVGMSHLDPEAKSWGLQPYRNNNLCFDYIPEDKYFFNIFSSPEALHPIYHRETSCNSTSFNIVKVVEDRVKTIKEGIESGFFGSIIIQEEEISRLNLKEWEMIIKGISKELKNIPHILKSYDFISMYAENRSLSYISKSLYDKEKDELFITLNGKSRMKQQICLFVEEDETILEKLIEIPEFEGSFTLDCIC